MRYASWSTRRSEQNAGELFEAATLLIVDFMATPPTFTFHPALLSWGQFFEVLIDQVLSRG